MRKESNTDWCCKPDGPRFVLTTQLNVVGLFPLCCLFCLIPAHQPGEGKFLISAPRHALFVKAYLVDVACVEASSMVLLYVGCQPIAAATNVSHCGCEWHSCPDTETLCSSQVDQGSSSLPFYALVSPMGF